METKILLLPSKESYEKLSRQEILSANLIAWECGVDTVCIEKDRFRGQLGNCSRDLWDKLVDQHRKWKETL